MKALFTAQAAWSHNQQQDMEFRNDRFEHILHILRTEIHQEHERENNLLNADPKALPKLQSDLWIERYTAVDRITDTIQAYGLAAGLDDLDLIMFTLDNWRKTQRGIRNKNKMNKKLEKQLKTRKREQKMRMKKGLEGSLIGMHDMVCASFSLSSLFSFHTCDTRATRVM